MRPIPQAIRQSGISLVEVLVSLVIFSLGLLGAAGLQLSSLRSSQFSANAAVAMAFAKEYEEFLQMVGYAGRSTGYSSAGVSRGAMYYTTHLAESTSAYADTQNLRSANLAGSCTGATCTLGLLSTAYQSDWAARLRAQLPGGRAVVCAMRTPFDPATGDLSWPACTDPGAYVVIFIGWTAKNDQGETTFGSDRPKMAINVFGNYYDYRYQ